MSNIIDTLLLHSIIVTIMIVITRAAARWKVVKINDILFTCTRRVHTTVKGFDYVEAKASREIVC